MLLPLQIPLDSLRNLVLNALFLDSNGSTVETIRSNINIHYSRKLTYQGVRKILLQFQTEGVALKQDKLWVLSNKWLSNVKLALDSYNKKLPFFTASTKSVHFSTLKEGFEYFITNINRIKLDGEHEFLCHLKNVALFVLTKEQKQILSEFIEQNDVHILVEKQNFVNKFICKYLSSLGANIYMGVPRSTPQILFVYGSTFVNVHFHFDIISYMTKRYSNIFSFKDVHDVNAFEEIAEDSTKTMTITFETDPSIVHDMRVHLKKLIKKHTKNKI